MMTLSPVAVLLAAGFALVGLGLYALVTSQHVIRLLVALQLIAKGTLLALLAAGQQSGRMDLAQALMLTVIVVDTVVTTAGLALAVRIRRRLGTLELRDLATLTG